MYRFLAQVAYVLIDPFIWSVVLFLLAFLYRRRKLSSKLLLSGVLVLLFFSNRFIANYVLYLWEHDPMDITSLKDESNMGILLGGFSHHESDRPYSDELFYYNELSANRLSHSLELLAGSYIDTLMISDGFVNKESRISEMEHIMEYLRDLGFDGDAIIPEYKGHNTHLNAVYCTEKVRSLNLPDNHPVYLITSASHMRRGLACFKKEGLEVIPLAVDHKAGPGELTVHTFIPSSQALVSWKILLKEWVGIVVYKLLGYI